MRSLKINSITLKTAIYTIAILITIGFAVYPSTNSYFLKNIPNSIAYTSSLDSNNLSGITKIELSEKSNIDTIRLTLELKRDTRYSEEKDEYVLEIENSTYKNAACKIITDSKQNINITEDGKITFNNNKTTGKVDVECDIKDNIKNKSNININVKMYEIINDEDRISYGKVNYTETYIDYFNKYGNIIYINKTVDGSETPKDDGEVYNEFIELLKKHYDILASDSESYVNKYNISKNSFVQYAYDQFEKTLNEENQIVGINAIDVLFNINPFPIMGVTRTEVKEGNKVIGYAYSFEESLTGYVKTNEWYNNPNSTGTRLYFSTNNSDMLKEEVEYFLKKYNQPEGTQLYNYINTYITKKFSGVYSIDNLSSIPGIYYIAAGDNTKYPFLTADILASDLAENYLNIIEAQEKGSNTITIKVNHYDEKDFMKEIFSYGASEAYGDSYDNIYNKIDNKGDFYASLTCKTNCSDYEEVYYKYSDNKYYSIKVNHKDGYNEVEITTSTTSPISGSSKLNAAITCKENCNYNHEMHFSNNIYTEYKVSQYNNEGNRIVVTKSNDNPIVGSKDFNDNITNNHSYNETHYDGSSFYFVQVFPTSGNNPVIVTIDNMGNNKPASFSGSYLFDKALECRDSKNCSSYKELRYIAKSYYFLTVIPKDSVAVIKFGDPRTNAQEAFKALGYNVESINLSLDNNDYLGNIPSAENTYNEIHFDGENYLLVKVKTYSSQKIITVSKLWSPTISKENETTLEYIKDSYSESLTDLVYFFHVKDLNHMQTYLEKYLKNNGLELMGPETDSTGPALNGYISGRYEIEDIY